MNPNQGQFCRPSSSTRSTSLTTATGPPTHPHAPVHRVHSINPLLTLRNPSKAHSRPYLYSSHPFPTRVPLSFPYLSSPTSTPSHATATPSQVLSAWIPSTRYSSLQPPSLRPPLLGHPQPHFPAMTPILFHLNVLVTIPPAHRHCTAPLWTNHSLPDFIPSDDLRNGRLRGQGWMRDTPTTGARNHRYSQDRSLQANPRLSVQGHPDQSPSIRKCHFTL